MTAVAADPKSINGDETEEALSIAECPKVLQNGLSEGDEQKHWGQIEVRLMYVSCRTTVL